MSDSLIDSSFHTDCEFKQMALLIFPKTADVFLNKMPVGFEVVTIC